MKIRTLLTGLVATTLVAGSANAAFLTGASSGFTNQYDGSDIWDGGALVNDWTVAGGMTNASLSLSGSDLLVNSDGNNGWVQHNTDGVTPWDNGSGDFAVEVDVQLVDNDANVSDVTTIWAQLDGDAQIIVITATSVEVFGGAVIAGGLDNTSASHTYRINHDASAAAGSDYQILRDGVLLGTVGASNPGFGADNRLIIGDCCTTINGVAANPVDTTQLGYVRYTFVPEPGSLALLGLGGLLIARRRRA